MVRANAGAAVGPLALALWLLAAGACCSVERSSAAISPPPASAPTAAVSSAPNRVSATPEPTVDGAATAPAADAGLPQKPTLRFLAFGDLIVSYRVGRAIAAANDPLLPFRSLDGLLSSVDFSFANLEAPFDRLRAKSEHELGGLSHYNFKVLSLANNHAMDRGQEGLWHTLALLRSKDIVPVGVGRNMDEAWAGAVVEIRGFRIGFVAASYTSINSSRKLWLDFVARITQRHRLRKTIRALRKRCDFVVAAMHAGVEYVRWPSREQILFAQAAIDSGADIVIGSHPHVVQPVRSYRGKYIFYSLGNFIFDQTRPDAVKESAAVRITLSKPSASALSSKQSAAAPASRPVATLEALEVIALINNNVTRPRLALPAEAARILRRMELRHAALMPRP